MKASKRPLQQVAYDTIHGWIRKALLAKGTVTSETALSERLHMSRTPVRAALQRLELEGYVRIVPKHGIVILDASAQRVGDLLDSIGALLLYSLAIVRSDPFAATDWPGDCRAMRRQLAELDARGAAADELAAAEYALLERVIAQSRNGEFAAAFAHAAGRLAWPTNMRRWDAPFRGETLLRLDALLAAAGRESSGAAGEQSVAAPPDAAPAPDPGQAVLAYVQLLKRTWR